MTLSAGSLSSFQRCPRQWLLNQSDAPIRRWRPTGLFISCFRSAIAAIAAGTELERATDTAVTEFMEQAAKPGLETAGEPYILARDFASILRTSLASAHASRIPSLKAVPSIHLSPDVRWNCGALIDTAGHRPMLHSWISVDSLNSAVLARTLHGWRVFGDCAATGLPMTLHVLEIGRQAGSHQNTPWCRSYRHPAIAGRFAFQQADGKPLSGDWKPVWYQDSSRNDPQTWIRMMERDGVKLLRSVPVRHLSPATCKEGIRQILYEAGEMEKISGMDWKALPLRRTACDLPLCSWQFRCYAP